MKNTELLTDVVVYDETVKLLFFELVDILYQKEYFGFLDEAKEYVSNIEQYFKVEIPKLHRLGLTKKAMPYFERYGKDLYFVAYRRVKSRTTWYSFYEVLNDRYFKIVHIINNHTAESAYIEHNS